MTGADDLDTSFYGPENRVPLRDAAAIASYLEVVGRALGGFGEVVAGGGDRAGPEAGALRDFAGRLRATVDLLAKRHRFSASPAPLCVDTTDSGLPHFSTLMDLAADLEARDELLADLRGGDALRRALRDALLRPDVPVAGLRRALARRSYLEALAEGSFLLPFQAGPLTDLAGGEARARALVTFSTYDRAENRPHLYLLWLELEGASRLEPGGPTHRDILRECRRLATGSRTLLEFASELDRELPEVHPLIVRRFRVGPFLAPGLTTLPGPEGALLDRHRAGDPFLLRWEEETLVAAREARVGAGVLAAGQVRQVYWVPEDPRLARRGASRVDRALLAPAWFGQVLDEEEVLPDHGLHVLTARNEVHGSH